MTRTGANNNRRAQIAGAMLVFLLFAGGAGVGSAAERGGWPRATYYTVVVRPGETLYALSARYDLPVVAVARLNRLNPQSEIHPGEVLRIPAESLATREAVLSEALDRRARNYAPPPRSFQPVSYAPAQEIVVRPLPPPDSLPAQREPTAQPDESRWGTSSRQFAWPVTGPILSPFGVGDSGERNDGINIAVEPGAPIHAAAAGTVTYAGNELKDYGNLILITHGNGYVTAYAHAQSIMVARGEHVQKGQVIATAGQTGGVDRPQLHFEIRHGVRPINPRLLLAASR